MNSQNRLLQAFLKARSTVKHSTQLLGRVKDSIPSAHVIYLENFGTELYEVRAAELSARIDGSWVMVEIALVTLWGDNFEMGTLLLTRSEAVELVCLVSDNMPKVEAA